MYKHKAFSIYCMWFMNTLKSRIYMDMHINLSIESLTHEACLGWSLALTDLWLDSFTVCSREFGSTPGLFQTVLYRKAQNKDFKR